MKVVVISEQTRQRMLSEDPLLGDLDNQLKDIEKKKKEDDSKKKNNDNNNVIVKPNDSKVDNNKVDNNKVDNNKVDNNKVDNNKVDNNKVDNNKVDKNKVDNNKVDKNKVDTNKPEYKIDKSTPTIDDFKSEPVKPTNPSGKVIPKPTKPLMKNSPAAKAGISKEIRQKFANQNAAFQATKNKDSGYTKMDFIKDFPQSQTAKKFNKGERIPGFSYKKNLKNSYEPYHIVLGYVLSEGHAETVEEAHYVMTQMDSETIQEIVALDENPYANAARITGVLTLGGLGLNAIRKMGKNKETMEKGGEFRKGSTMDNIQKKNKMLNDLNTGNY